jgi:hypothetical protein
MLHQCPACGASVAETPGEVLPRPCPECLESSSQVVQMLPQASEPERDHSADDRTQGG